MATKNAQLAIKNGLKIRTDKPQNTGDLWGFTGLDDDFRLVNQFLKYMKFGFGHVTDQVCEAIHQKFMSRNEAIDIAKKYDGKIHKKYIKKFCDYVDMPINEFWRNVDEIVNKELFVKKMENGLEILKLNKIFISILKTKFNNHQSVANILKKLSIDYKITNNKDIISSQMVLFFSWLAVLIKTVQELKN